MAGPSITTPSKESKLTPEPVEPAETEPLDDEQLTFVILLHARNEFVKTLGSEYITDCMKRFASCYGIPENCRLVKIFGTFEAGMSAGLDLALKTENYERNNAQ